MNDMPKIVSLANIAKEGQWDDFFNHSTVVVFKEEQIHSQRVFRQERSRVRNLTI